MISPVSFSAVQGSNFTDLISRPQAYTRTETPAAASTLKDEKGKKGAAKKVGIAIVVTAAVLAALGLGAKKGIFTSDKIKQEWLKKGLGYLDKAGNWIADKAIKAKDFVISKLPKAAKESSEAVETVAEKAAEVAETVVK